MFPVTIEKGTNDDRETPNVPATFVAMQFQNGRTWWPWFFTCDCVRIDSDPRFIGYFRKFQNVTQHTIRHNTVRLCRIKRFTLLRFSTSVNGYKSIITRVYRLKNNRFRVEVFACKQKFKLTL